jgi:nitrite reductase/ring-hydroxylating ferredoxin subunit
MAQINRGESGLAAQRPARWNTVCELAEIDDPGARGFVLTQRSSLYGFVVRRGPRVCAYTNSCPHAGRLLQWKDDEFLTPDGRLLWCAAHGALFEIETGLCVAGPCAGARLCALSVRVAGGLVDVAA